MIYLGDARIFNCKCVKWDRDVLGGNFFYSRKSVLVGVRWISKEEVWRLTERDRLSGSFWWFTTGHRMEHDTQKIAQIYNSDLVGYDITKFCSVCIIAG